MHYQINMSRPKESKYGLITGAATLYSANKVRKMGNELSSLRSSIAEGTELTLSAIGTIGELQVATMAGLIKINEDVSELSQAQWELVSFFEDEKREREILGDLKLFLRSVGKELTNIKKISETHPIYACYLAEKLREIFLEKDVRLEHFKLLSVSEIEWADEIITEVETLFDIMYGKLGD